MRNPLLTRQTFLPTYVRFSRARSQMIEGNEAFMLRNKYTQNGEAYKGLGTFTFDLLHLRCTYNLELSYLTISKEPTHSVNNGYFALA